MKRFSYLLTAVIAMVTLGGCASMEELTAATESPSVLAYLYQGSGNVPTMADATAEIRVPFRIGAACAGHSCRAIWKLCRIVLN